MRSMLLESCLKVCAKWYPVCAGNGFDFHLWFPFPHPVRSDYECSGGVSESAGRIEGPYEVIKNHLEFFFENDRLTLKDQKPQDISDVRLRWLKTTSTIFISLPFHCMAMLIPWFHGEAMHPQRVWPWACEPSCFCLPGRKGADVEVEIPEVRSATFDPPAVPWFWKQKCKYRVLHVLYALTWCLYQHRNCPSVQGYWWSRLWDLPSHEEAKYGEVVYRHDPKLFLAITM